MEPLIKQGAKATKDNTRDLWQTPPYILDLVDKFFDGEWFDPCPVDSMYDGLKFRWYNHCYINPPFSQYKDWATYGVSEHLRCQGLGETPSHIYLSHTNHDTKWYQLLLNHASAICFLKKRVRFIDSRTGQQSKNTAIGKCQTLFYLGNRPKKFYKTFGELGFSVIIKDRDKLSSSF